MRSWRQSSHRNPASLDILCSKSLVKPLWIILIAVVAGALSGAEKKPKPPDVEVVEASAHRGETRISLEGRVRNSGEKPIKKLTIVFHFMAPGKHVITSQSASVDEELLAPGEESVFHMELNDPPRSVEFQIGAADGSGRELRVGKPGPFPIE